MKTILITGSSSGIGRATTELLLADNHQVIGLARDHKKFQPNHQNYINYSVDFADDRALNEKLKTILKTHPYVDHIICCAGYGEFGKLEQFSYRQMKAVMQVNFLSQALLIKLFLRQLKKKTSSKIIIIGSESAITGAAQGTIYCASKFALRGFCQALRQECATNSLAVTLINPGATDTPFFDDLSFQPGSQADNKIDPHQVAQYIQQTLTVRSNLVPEEINLQPMKRVFEKKTEIERD